MDQSQGDRSGYHTISGIGHHFGPAGLLCGTNSLDLMCKCFLDRLELKTHRLAQSVRLKKKNLLLEIECILLIFDYY